MEKLATKLLRELKDFRFQRWRTQNKVFVFWTIWTTIEKKHAFLRWELKWLTSFGWESFCKSSMISLPFHSRIQGHLTITRQNNEGRQPNAGRPRLDDDSHYCYIGKQLNLVYNVLLLTKWNGDFYDHS